MNFDLETQRNIAFCIAVGALIVTACALYLLWSGDRTWLRLFNDAMKIKDEWEKRADGWRIRARNAEQELAERDRRVA
ncbi:MAG TPA: hypothetical protein VH020_09320 [Stellaceae bacterium]|jgi:hypothetical protein|nr:hypothetical protein [Stellaceae bacterium]